MASAAAETGFRGDDHVGLLEKSPTGEKTLRKQWRSLELGLKSRIIDLGLGQN